jgi:hypothetical protein
MYPIDEAFALWLARVEALVGHAVDPKKARQAFECYEYPVKPLTPIEYAYEVANG